MTGGQIFGLAIAAVAVVAAAGIFAVALKRGPGKPPPTGRLSRRDMAKERRRERQLAAVGAPAGEAVEPVAAQAEPEDVPDPLATRRELSEEEYGVTRRMFFNRSLTAVFGIFLLQFTLGSLAFLWPRLRAGAFGSEIDAGDLNEIKNQLFNADGTVTPFFAPEPQAYIVPFQGDVGDSQFDASTVVEGIMALWQRCVHLGCRVPVCDSSQGFECPCHGSKYNFHGEYEAGPAPRNLDRFVISVNDAGRLIIDTGTVIQTARAKDKTAEYPQGPSCLSA